MSNPLLERWSWGASIVSCVIAAVGIYFSWPSSPTVLYSKNNAEINAVLLFTSEVPQHRVFKYFGDVVVSLHESKGREAVDKKLREKAASIGANAVITVKYNHVKVQSGAVGDMIFGGKTMIEATGMAVQLLQ